VIAIDPASPLAAALGKARAGDLAGAGVAAEAAIAAGDRSPQLAAFAGLIACQLGDPGRGIPHLRAALNAAPGDLATRVNLARALVACERLDEAAALCAGVEDPRLDRIAGYAHQQAGRLDEAAAAYERALAAVPDDFESWNNLGNVRAAQADSDGAIAALRRAAALRPDAAPVRLNLARALAKAERYGEQLEAVRAANALTPDDPEILTELGLAEASVEDYAGAQRAFRAAIAADPLHLAAYLELGVLLEALNKTDALRELADQAAAQGLPEREAGFLRAWALRREGRYAEALPLAEGAADAINPVRRTQLIGELADRLCDTERAFAAYTEMNRASVAAAPPSAAGAGDFLAEVRGIAERTTPEAIAQWNKIAIDPAPPAPIFIVGFPRSGTTLLDTLLMNLPALHVFEEEPILNHAEAGLGDLARIGAIASAEANALRARYFEAATRIAPESRSKTIVDKFPLHMARMPIIHRLFPDAKVVFVERHPCDVVLSCFMANFQLNRAMANMTTLEDAARLYDAAQDAWTRATELLPIKVKRIRYEAMIDDLEGEMRALLAFLGLEWDPAVLDNRGSAARRAHISTASYSQVTEPIYRRAVARWERYRAQLAPIIPIVAPWAERMGYSM
jgi:tetratricopeptide (TPR) repeat protein